MFFKGYMRIMTGVFVEYYEIVDDTYCIGDPIDFPPTLFRFHMQIIDGKECNVINLTPLHTLYWIKKITQNLLIDYTTDEYFKSDLIDIWII